MKESKMNGQKKVRKITKKQRKRAEEQAIFSMGVRESSRRLYQAFAAYCGLTDSPPEAVESAKGLLLSWVEDGSKAYQLEPENKKRWDQSVFAIFSGIRESVIKSKPPTDESPLILPPGVKDEPLNIITPGGK